MATKAYRVAFIAEAEVDLAIIRGGNLGLAGATRAAQRYAELVLAGHELATFPERFERLPPALTAGRHIRRRPVGHHLLIYRIDEAETRVVVLGYFVLGYFVPGYFVLGYFDSRRAPWRLGAPLDPRGGALP